MRARKPIPAQDLKRTRKGELKRRNPLWRWRRSLFLLGLLMATTTAGVGYVLSQVELPNDGVAEVEAQTSYLCGADVPPGTRCNAGNAIAAFHGDEDRENVTLDQVPEVLQQAVLSAEDRDYFEHSGVDPSGIARAAWSDIRSRGGRQGGSTITQQYVKNVFLTNERTFNRKIKEAVMAIKLEKKVSKRDILERYLNVVYFGRGAYGVQAASQAYFGKDVEDIGLAESTFLAGLIRSPETAEPFDSQAENAEARRRRLTVLVAMEEEGYIPAEAVEMVDAVPLDMFNGLLPPKASAKVDFLRGADTGSQYFVMYVLGQLEARYGEEMVYGGGLRIHTTLDPDHQRAAWDAVTTTLDQPADPAAALVSVDEQGHVKAMMGGRNFGVNADEGQSQVNLAIGREGGGSGRQPGSTFKPFVLAEAVREGYSIRSKVLAPDDPDGSEIELPSGEKWLVRGGCCGGRTDLIEATKQSVNTAYASMMVKLTPEAVVETANDLGITSDLAPDHALVLGAGEVSVLEMASAYSTFSRGGVRTDPISILQVELPGGQIDRTDQDSREVLTPTENAKVVHVLEKVLEEDGTGATADFGRPAAGKTGTSQENRNAWFVGFTPKLTAAVWMGYPGGAGEEAAPMVDVHGMTVTGSNFPAEIWRKYMVAVADTDVGDFPPLPVDLYGGKPLFPELVTRPRPPTTERRRPPRTTQPPPPTTERDPSPPTTEAPPTTQPPTTVPPTTTPPTTAPPTTRPPTTRPPKPPKPPKPNPPPTTQLPPPTTQPPAPPSVPTPSTVPDPPGDDGGDRVLVPGEAVEALG